MQENRTKSNQSYYPAPNKAQFLIDVTWSAPQIIYLIKAKEWSLKENTNFSLYSSLYIMCSIAHNMRYSSPYSFLEQFSFEAVS